MVNCKIILENNQNAVYHVGQLLKGTIELYLHEPKKFRGFYFNVYGAAKCHWTESRTVTSGSGRNRTTRTETTHFNGKDVYLNSRTYLFGADGADAMVIPSGTHRYDFACQLPPQLPASFEASYGSIRYKIEAVLDVPWSFDKEFNLQFTVVRIDDLNFHPELKIPSKAEEVKRFCCLFCESEPLMMTVTIPYTGYTPGQNIHVTIMYNNKSDVEITTTKIFLKRIIQFHSQTPRHKIKSESEKMVEIYVGGVEASRSTKIEKDLKIPEITICSNSEYCKVVQIFYALQVEAVVPGCHSNIDLTFPITIGSIPLNFDPIPMLQPTAPLSIAEINYYPVPFPSAPVRAPIPELELPPPSFDEAIKMKNKEENNLNRTSVDSLTAYRLGWKHPPSNNPSAITDN